MSYKWWDALGVFYLLIAVTGMLLAAHVTTLTLLWLIPAGAAGAVTGWRCNDAYNERSSTEEG